MITFNNDSIDFLKNLDTKGWYDILDKIFNYETLADPINYQCEHLTDYFLELGNAVTRCNDSDFKNHFHTMLIQYYLNLPISEPNYATIYTLHWVLARYKPRVEVVDKLYEQLYHEDLNNKYYQPKGYTTKVHLNSSLLSLIRDLPGPDIFDDSSMVSYLFSSTNRINDYSFFRVALKYLIEKKTIDNYWDYFYKITYKYQNEVFADILTKSIMDFQDYFGGFQKVFETVDNNHWNEYSEKFPDLFNKIIYNLNNNYLITGKPWYDDIIYAELFKGFINNENPPLPKTLVRVYQKLSEEEAGKAVIKLLRCNKKWKNRLHTVPISFSFDESDNEYIVFIQSDADFYKRTYQVPLTDLSENSENIKLQNIITEYCDPEYSLIAA